MKLDTRKEIETQIKDGDLVRVKHLQIATGATKLFLKKGYFKTSIREISKVTGITIGNLYDYITKKEDILYLVFNVFHSVWVTKLNEEGVFNIEDPIEQLKTALRKMVELTTTHRDMILLMYTETKSLPKDYLKNILENESGLIRCFERILRVGVEGGVFNVKDPFLMANIIVYLLSFEPLRGWNFRKVYKLEEVTEYLIESIIHTVLSSSKGGIEGFTTFTPSLK